MDTCRAALYIRVSTLEQAREGYSLAAQETNLREYCSRKGYQIVGIYMDEGRSAKSIVGREAFQQLVADGLAGQFDVVVVWKITRFARNVADFILTCERLEHKGVYVESVSEAYDPKTPVGRLVRGILAVVAEWEREIIAENVIAAMAERASQGKRTCSYVLGYDRDGPDSFKINETEAEVVRYIYRTYLRLKNIAATAAKCNAQGYRGKTGAAIKCESVHKILTRPVYCGYNMFHGTIYTGSHAPIIPVGMYNRVQRELQARMQLGRPRKYPLIQLPS